MLSHFNSLAHPTLLDGLTHPTLRLTILAVAIAFMVLEYLLSRLIHHDDETLTPLSVGPRHFGRMHPCGATICLAIGLEDQLQLRIWIELLAACVNRHRQLAGRGHRE